MTTILDELRQLKGDLTEALETLRRVQTGIEAMYSSLNPGPGDDPRWLVYPLNHTAPVTGEFGEMYTIGGLTWQHEGIDFGIPSGTPILACASGVVVANAVRAGYGLCVKLEHVRAGEKWWTWYAHLSAVDCVLGQSLIARQVLGLSGASGNVTGPHLHLTVQRAASAYQPAGCTTALRGVVNPREWIKWGYW